MASIRAINYRLKVAREEQQKREEIIERGKTETMAAKRQRARGRISLSNEEEENYKSNTGDETNSDQAGDNKNSL